MLVSKVFDHKFRRTTLIIFGSLSFLGGSLYAQQASAGWEWLLPALFFLTSLKFRRFVALVIVIYGCFIFGIVRGNIALEKENVLRQFMGQKITLHAVISDDSYFDSKKRVTFTANAFEILSPPN